MDKQPLRIAVTPPDALENEPIWIKVILEAGWDYVHLRHPGATLREMKAIIESLPPVYHSRLRLHGHFELLNEFNLGGIHLNSRCPDAPARYNGSVSRTCHTIEEVQEYKDYFDYMTLSPIFPSVSKPGYSGSFAAEELASLPEGKVVALGGVTPLRMPELALLPFKGYAVLGYLAGAKSIEDLRLRLGLFND